MPVAVRLPTVLRSEAGGQSSVSVEGATIGEVLRSLVADHPGIAPQVFNDDGTLHKFVNVYVNDDDVRYLSLLDTPVKDGDEVSILPAVAGGTT
ncbi:MAG TPA: ubiquitin-like small modifier protein 1 [Acidimicrobiales bacterium]|nr:ubiquitin-like small modifier protein 1 [Acidimicrobiales bacterium]